MMTSRLKSPKEVCVTQFQHTVEEIYQVHPGLRIQLPELGPSTIHVHERLPTRSSKRRRLSKNPDPTKQDDVVRDLTQRVYGLLGSQSVPDLDGLDTVAVWVNPLPSGPQRMQADLTKSRGCFPRLSVSDQCTAFSHLGALACAHSGTFNSSQSDDEGRRSLDCGICDSAQQSRTAAAFWSIEESKVVYSTLERLIRGPTFHDSGKARIAAMLTVRKLLTHTEDTARLSLPDSPLGQWCLQSHYSSVRELRIAAG